MSERLVAAASLALVLFGCDPNVVVGYAAARVSARDASTSRLDASPAPDDGGSMTDAADAADAVLPSVSWTSGAHAGNDLSMYLDFGTWRGRPLDLAHVFPDRTQGWEGIVNPAWPVDMFSPFPGKLLMSVPVYPEGQGNNQDCASGAYDSEWRKLGSFLVDRKRPDTIIRLGWGPNDLSHPWHADADPSNWISCFRHAVAAIRATDPQVRIDWSFNSFGASYVASWDPYTDYPGDAYVDFVGIEAYDRFPASHSDSEWNTNCNAPTGLCRVIAFAREHGKRVGIGEWGVVTCGEDSGGDNPFFVQKMFETFAANSDVMGYEAYFESDLSDVCSSIVNGGQSPKAAAKYIELYSRH